MAQKDRTAGCGASNEALNIMKSVIGFVKLFMPETLAKRVLSIILISAGLENPRITELTGYCDRSVRGLRKEMAGGFKKNGYKRLKSGFLPAKADAEGQRRFYDSVLHPLMEKAKADELSLLSMDASHFVLGCGFLGCIYCRLRRFVRTFSGRKRYNVLGAIDYATKNVLTATNGTYITATEVCEMPQRISTEYAGRAVHIVLDNARYQKYDAVRSRAAELGTTLQYIPPYSPNLSGKTSCLKLANFFARQYNRRKFRLKRYQPHHSVLSRGVKDEISKSIFSRYVCSFVFERFDACGSIAFL